MPEYNVKTDRFEVAVIAMDAVAKSHLAKREARHNPPKQTAEPSLYKRLAQTETANKHKWYACIFIYQGKNILLLEKARKIKT